MQLADYLKKICFYWPTEEGLVYFTDVTSHFSDVRQETWALLRGVGAAAETPPPSDLRSIYSVSRQASVQDAHWSRKNVAGKQTTCSRHDWFSCCCCCWAFRVMKWEEKPPGAVPRKNTHWKSVWSPDYHLRGFDLHQNATLDLQQAHSSLDFSRISPLFTVFFPKTLETLKESFLPEKLPMWHEVTVQMLRGMWKSCVISTCRVCSAGGAVGFP